MNTQSQLTISGQNIDITPALQDHITEKFGKIQKTFEIVMSMHITLEIDNFRQIAKAEVNVAGDPNPLYAEAVTDDMYISIDEVEHKILAQISRYHDKLKDHHDRKH